MTFTPPDFVVIVGEAASTLDADRLDDPLAWPPCRGGDAVAQIRIAPRVRAWTRGSLITSLQAVGGLAVVSRRQFAAPERVHEQFARWRATRRSPVEGMRGRFARVLWDDEGRIHCCTDAFRTVALHVAQRPGLTLVASDLRLVLASGIVSTRLRREAIFHFLNLSYVPAPHTPLDGVMKIPAGSVLQGPAGAATLDRYWDVHYPEDLAGTEAERTAQLRDKIVSTIHASRPDGDAWGAFLSGGTDSSSIAGILARQRPETPVRTYSIGFGEAGYDELGYVRIAARQFGLASHEAVVDERAAVAAIPRILDAFDEPFGNSSAIPSYHCAALAAEQGVTTMVAGDGGDEIFGGNERYRKDAVFQLYRRAPRALRAAAESVARALRDVDARTANRVKNFVRRGALPNPDRFYSDDAFASEHFEELLSGDFRRGIAPDATLALMRATYGEADARSELNRLLYLDLKLTIADNDVVKVVKTARLAGVDVVFPYLDRDLVEFTGRLPVRDKLRGGAKRYLFKQAMNGILPPQIIRKKKQGFGLPVSTWLRSGGPFLQLVADTLLSARCRERGIVSPAFTQALMERHRKGAWDHAAELYMLMMLELWLQARVDANG